MSMGIPVCHFISMLIHDSWLVWTLGEKEMEETLAEKTNNNRK